MEGESQKMAGTGTSGGKGSVGSFGQLHSGDGGGAEPGETEKVFYIKSEVITGDEIEEADQQPEEWVPDIVKQDVDMNVKVEYDQYDIHVGTSDIGTVSVQNTNEVPPGAVVLGEILPRGQDTVMYIDYIADFNESRGGEFLGQGGSDGQHLHNLKLVTVDENDLEGQTQTNSQGEEQIQPIAGISDVKCPVGSVDHRKNDSGAEPEDGIQSDEVITVAEIDQADKQAEECIEDIVQEEAERNILLLEQAALEADIDEEESESDEDENSDDDDDYEDDSKGKGRRTVKNKRKREKKHRLIGQDQEDDDDVILRLQSYRKRKVDPMEKCPPPAPKKIRGGRKTLLKKTKESEIPEDEVQKACYAFKNRKSLRPEEAGGSSEVNRALVPYSGPPLTPLLRQHAACVHFYEEWVDVMKMIQEGKLISQLSMKEVLRKCRPSYGIANHLYYEHLNHVAHCAQEKKEIDPTLWTMEFADEIMKQGRFRLEMKSITNTAFISFMQEMAVRAHHKLARLRHYCVQSASTLSAFKEDTPHVLNMKYKMQVSLTDLHTDLSTRDPMFDELSITGIRHVKMFLDPPYFKTTDGAVLPSLIEEAVPFNIQEGFGFRWDKQKWTTKDLHALKQCIKDTIIQRKSAFVEARYKELYSDSAKKAKQELAEHGKSMDALYQPALKRKRGRPTKEEVQRRDRYGVISPTICILPGEIKVTYNVTPKFLGEWRTIRERRWRTMNFEALLRETGYEEINWEDVADKLMVRTRKWRSAADCELAYKHEVDPAVNTTRWSGPETVKLKELFDNYGNDWNTIVNELNTYNFNMQAGSDKDQSLRTSYLCFFRYRNRIAPPVRLDWTEEMDMLVKDGLKKYPGQWRLIAATLKNEAATKRAVVERYKKNINPMLRTGSFTRVEDALLLLTIQRLKPFLACEGHFGSLLAYLPWRYETTWRDRANNLFNDWIVPWTIEEDRLLLELAVTMKRNWQKISEQFTSFKNRKGCLTRYKILKRNLDNPRFKSLEDYHEAYSMTRYNVFQYRHLKEILELLLKVKHVNIDVNKMPFTNLSRETEPTEIELRHMLLCFDRKVLDATIHALQRYSSSRDEYWKQWVKKHGQRKRTFDRRTFHRDNPQSVASAIHIRGLKLKPKKQISNLNDFEDEVYMYFGRFCRTKPLSEDTKRPYIPSARDLINWSMISRIIATKEEDLKAEDDKEPCNSKWIRKGKSKASESKGRTPKRRGRKRKVSESEPSSETSDEDNDGGEYTEPEILPPKRRGRKV